MKDKRKSKTLSINDLTREFYNKDKFKKEIIKVEIIKTWNKITSPENQIRTKKILLKEYKLYIKITSSPLRNELANHKNYLLNKIQKKHPSVKEIYFV